MKSLVRLARSLAVGWFALAVFRLVAADFIHPGLLHNQQDLDRLKTAVATQSGPAYAGWPTFRDNNRSVSTYVMQGPFAEFGRPTPNITAMDNDCNAAYQNAVMWYVTGNSAHAAKAIQILNGWSATLTTISGTDAMLAAGLDGFKLINAAEILRYTNSGWAPADIARFEQWLKAVWYPVLEPFALYANGNWDVAAVKTMIAVGVFCNDRALFERAMRFHLDGAGNGRVTSYVVNEDGQAQESGRDQPHTMLGIGQLAEVSEVAWNQGFDLYATNGNRLLKGFEYTARYNLGQTVPFTPALDRSGKYGAGGSVENYSIISEDGRGQYRPVFEMAWNHYVNRAGLAAPFTKQYADLNRPEGPAQTADHPGFGTFLFSRDPVVPSAPVVAPAGPSAVFAHATPGGIVVSWPSVLGASSYAVQRATGAGAFAPLATGLTAPTFTDSATTAGELYRYVVSAANAVGASADSTAAAATANGLPAPWSHQDVGSVAVAGAADHDGQVFTLEAAGTDIGGASDSFRFAFVPLTGNGTIVARVINPLSSQLAKVGVMVRESLAANAAHASVLIAPSWNATWTTRATTGGATTVSGTSALPLPYVFNNRLMQPYWLRLTRAGDTFTGSISPDGAVWTQIGSSTIPMAAAVLVGLPACSRLTTVTTTASFDNVSVPGWSTAAPAAPGNLVATLIENRIALSWNAAAGTSAYTVRRATASGGPYGVIATTTLATTFTDTTPAVGQSYYYVVTAAAAAGASPASNEATALVPFPPAPVITSATSANGTVGAAFAYTITATNQPTSFTATGLPANLTLNSLTGAISGTLNATGVFSITLTATNSGGTGSAVLTLSTRPTITSAPLASTYAGSPLSYTIVATSQPTAFDATGLPAGLSVNFGTGVISGTPTVTGSFPVNLSATNLAGTGTAALTITVVPPPGPPAPWVDVDIGAAVGGITSFANGAFTIRAAGNNVGAAADNYHHLYRSVTGNFSLVARMAATAFAGTNDQVGLGLRASTASGAVAAVVMLDHGNDRVYLNTRATTNATATQSNTNSATGLGAPLWLRLTRAGNVLSGYYSTNGETWTQVAANTTLANMPATASLGPVIASRRVNLLNTSTFDHMTITTAAPVITTATVNGTVGSPFQFTVAATNTPYLYRATGLPAGLVIDPDTGVIAGTPVVAGSFAVTLTAINGFGTGAGGGTGTAPLTLTIARGPAIVTIGSGGISPVVKAAYDGSPRSPALTTNPSGLSVVTTYDGSTTPPTLPGTYHVVTTVSDSNYTGTADGTLVVRTTALVRHAPTVTGMVDGSVQLLSAENVTLGGTSTVTGDLLVPGTPGVTVSGSALLAGTLDGPGAADPAGYSVTLNTNALLRYLVRRIDPVALPVVAAPPAPAGTRVVSLTAAGQSAGDFATLKNLTLSANAGLVAVPPGTYGNFAVGGNSTLVLGVPGATVPAVYNLQNLSLNVLPGSAKLQIVGPVIIILANPTILNGVVGEAAHPEWLVLQIATGGLTISGSNVFHGGVTAPNGTVTLNNTATVNGTVVSDKLTLNGTSILNDPDL